MNQYLLSILCWNVQIEKEKLRAGSLVVVIHPVDQANRVFSVANHQNIRVHLVSRDCFLNQKCIGGIVLDNYDRVPVEILTQG